MAGKLNECNNNNKKKKLKKYVNQVIFSDSLTFVKQIIDVPLNSEWHFYLLDYTIPSF